MSSMLKPVETHVRIMSQKSSFQHHGPGQISMNVGSHQEQVYCTATQVHEPQSNDAFFDDVLRPVVSSALAGQSTTILFVGPGNCGRSHTVYGSDQEPGMVRLFGAELLKSPEAVVDVSGFKTNGDTVVDLVSDKPVRCERLQPPLGYTVLPCSIYLKNERDAVLQPKRRSGDDSCFVQFRVYRKLDNYSLRSAFATVTFVDVAAFSDSKMPRDVDAIHGTIQKIAAGKNDSFDHCKLTSVLETSLIGSTSLMCIATVTGSSSIGASVGRTLQFVHDAGKVNQVVSIVQFVPPASLAEALREMTAMEAKMKQGIQTAKEAGAAFVFQAATTQIKATFAKLPHIFSSIDQGIEKARQKVHHETATFLSHTDVQFDVMKRETEKYLSEMREYESKLDAETEEGNKVRAEVERIAQEINAIDADIEQQSILNEMKLAHYDAQIQEGQREQDRFHERRQLAHEKYLDALEVSNLNHEQLVYEGKRLEFDKEMGRLGSKRQRLETALSSASESAAVRNNTSRFTRELKSRHSLLNNIELQVNQLRGRLAGRTTAEASSFKESAAPQVRRQEQPTPTKRASPVPIPTSTSGFGRSGIVSPGGNRSLGRHRTQTPTGGTPLKKVSPSSVLGSVQVNSPSNKHSRPGLASNCTSPTSQLHKKTAAPTLF